MTVEKGSKITKATAPYYLELTNAYFSLAEFNADLSPEQTNTNHEETEITFKKKAAERRKKRKNKKVKIFIQKGQVHEKK